MSNPLFDALNGKNQNGSLFGGLGNLQNQFSEFASQFSRNSRMTPQQRVQQMLDSGQMSQEQFNNLRAMANRLMGRNF